MLSSVYDDTDGNLYLGDVYGGITRGKVDGTNIYYNGSIRLGEGGVYHSRYAGDGFYILASYNHLFKMKSLTVLNNTRWNNSMTSVIFS